MAILNNLKQDKVPEARHYCRLCKKKRFEKFMICVGMNENSQYSWQCKKCLLPGIKTEQHEIIKPLYWSKGYSEHGKSTIHVTCPFCNETHEVYAWSFAGCGKKCDCGAKLYQWEAHKKINK